MGKRYDKGPKLIVQRYHKGCNNSSFEAICPENGWR